MSFRYSLRVYFEDTDAGGIVYYGNYVRFMERARSEWFLQCSIGMKELMQTHGMVFVVARTELNYRKPAKLEDVLTIDTELIELKRISAVFRQRVYRQNELLCDGLTKVGCVETLNLKPIAIPQQVHDQLNQLVSPCVS